MSIPDYQSIMKPLLMYLNENPGDHRMQDVIEAMIKHFKLTDDERQELLPSGQQPVIDNRIGWARTYLKKAGLLEDPKRGYVKISKKGTEVALQNPPEINIKFLNQFKDFINFRKKRSQRIKQDNLIEDDTINDDDELPPNEMLEKGIELYMQNLPMNY